MHRHLLFGFAAWLLGAAAATAGSLLAVSLLGQGITGITGNSGQLLTQDAVNRELASEAPKAEPAPPPSTAPGAASSSPVPASSSPVPASSSPAPSSVSSAPRPGSATAVPPASSAGTGSGGTVLVSAGGEAVATCQAAGAYLTSWSPLQGYEVGDVSRGPAATARVTFESRLNRVTMVVSCSAGVPSATSSTSSGGDE